MVLKLFLMVVMLVRTSLVFAGPVTSLGLPWCVERNESLDKMQLNCLKSMDVSRDLRKSFDEIQLQKNSCPKCKLSVINGDKYFALYHHPFVVVAIKFPDSGAGYDLHIVFKERPMYEFLAWMDYDQARDTYKLGLIDAMEPSKKIATLVTKLQKKEFEQFWFER
ncbi:MAG: hypothetical protein HY074_10520 [Deltaproteobacteria bacterium]|nr:hypothetical protein [Deltaproteobacteria bacterium]